MILQQKLKIRKFHFKRLKTIKRIYLIYLGIIKLQSFFHIRYYRNMISSGTRTKLSRFFSTNIDSCAEPIAISIPTFLITNFDIVNITDSSWNNWLQLKVKFIKVVMNRSGCITFVNKSRQEIDYVRFVRGLGYVEVSLKTLSFSTGYNIASVTPISEANGFAQDSSYDRLSGKVRFSPTRDHSCFKISSQGDLKRSK